MKKIVKITPKIPQLLEKMLEHKINFTFGADKDHMSCYVVLPNGKTLQLDAQTAIEIEDVFTRVLRELSIQQPGFSDANLVHTDLEVSDSKALSQLEDLVLALKSKAAKKACAELVRKYEGEYMVEEEAQFNRLVKGLLTELEGSKDET